MHDEMDTRPALVPQQRLVIIQGSQQEATGQRSLVKVLSLLPSPEWVQAADFFFQIKPQIKNRSAIIAHLSYWIGDGTNPVSQLTLDDFEWMIGQIMTPQYVKRHTYGEAFGQILGDLATLFEQRVAWKRKKAEVESQKRYEESVVLAPLEDRLAAQQMAATLFGPAGRKRLRESIPEDF